MTTRTTRRWFLLVSLGAALGCSTATGDNTYNPDALDDAGGADEADGGCTTVPEECNGRDDDCDGLTDEGFDVETDPMNCGRCSNRCRFLNADAFCIEGTCRLGACREDYYDLNGEEGDGCEYRCIRTRTAEDEWAFCNDSIDNDCDGTIDFLDSDCSCVPEVCNHLDDNCNEEIDEDFDLTSDPENCGECAVVCPPRWHAATPICADSLCDFVCDVGWVDANEWPDDGCEARCTATSTEDADCDNEDDNCDGRLNEDFASVGCSIGVGGPDCAGVTACRLTGSGYAEICDVGRDVPEEDTTCDVYDDDCDGETDEDYRGAPCGLGVCAAFAPCVGGTELPCTPGTPTSATDTECNGLDDDCDSMTDEDYVPAVCGVGGCMRTALCIVGREWCSAGIPEAERCDGLDNDCDALTDDGFPCAVGAVQACTVTVPTNTCSGGQECSAACSWDTCLVPEGPGTTETCNAVDDDCDGTVDDAPTPPAAICPPAPHGTTGCSAGACVMVGCDAGWGDVNGSLADGCECATESPEAPDACGIARTLGTFPDSGFDVTVRGKLGSASDTDCYSLSAPDSTDSTCDNYHVDIRFTSNPSTQFQLTVYRGDCATIVCTGETSVYAWFTNFTTGSGTTKVGECPCRAVDTNDFNICSDNTSSYYFCVSRVSGFLPSCDEYSVRVTNGVF